MGKKSQTLGRVVAAIVLSGGVACQAEQSHQSLVNAEDSNASLASLATPELKIRQPGNHPTTYLVKVGQLTNALDSGFLLSMVGSDYTSTKIEKTFNLENEKLVLKTQAAWEVEARKEVMTSENPNFCDQLRAIKVDLQNAVTGDPVYTVAEPRLAPIASRMQEIFERKCR